MRTQTKLLSLVVALLFLGIIVAPASAQQMSVQFIIRDENNQPMSGVTVYIYSTTGSMPPTPGPLYAKITIDSGDYWLLPYGKYLCNPVKEGYVSRFPTEDNRISEGQTVCHLYMDRESSSEPEIGQPVTLRAIDESSNLIPGVTFKIYRCTSSPPYSPIELVRDEYSASGELYITDLPKDYYCVEVFKTGYSQRYPAGENRFANHDSSTTLNIVMDNEFPPVTLQAIDGTSQSLLPGVYFKIYYCDPVTFEQGALVKTTSVTSTGEIVVEGLSRDHYCFEAVKDGYRPRYPATEWRFSTVTDPPSSVTCIMDPDVPDNPADVPDDPAFDYFIEYGPFSTDDYGPYEAGWHGPVYDASPQYPLTDYEIDIDVDFSGNIVSGSRMGRILITGYSGDNVIWEIIVGDARSDMRRIDISSMVGDSTLAHWLGAVPADWSGPLKFVHSSPNYWELWVHDGLLKKSLTKPDIGPLTNITVALQLYSNYHIIPGMSCDRIAISEKVIEPNQPVEFKPYYLSQDGYIPLNGVQITVYTCDPATLEPGDVVDIFTGGLNYRDNKTPQKRSYCIEASLNNYEQVYPVSETRFSNVDGPAVALIPMEYIDPNQPVEFKPFDINGYIPLNGVRITVYTCDPETFEPGDVVDIFTVDYGDIKSLPRGHYCIEASLNNYEQVYPVSETRFSNVDGPAVALIPMEYVGGEDGSVEVRIVDVDTEEPLQNVRVRIYEALPNFQQGRLVKDVTVNSGDYISLPAGRYFAQATKSGYSQYFEVTNTRVVVDPPSPSILYIPMTSRDVVTPGEGSFLDQSIEGIANLFGVSFGVGKTILGMLLALGIGTATAKQLKGGAQEFGLGMLGGVVLGVLIGLLPIWVLVLLVLIVGLWIGHRYMSGGDS